MRKILVQILIISFWVSFVNVAFATTDKEYFVSGEQAYQSGDFKKAVTLLEKGVEINPNFAPAYNTLGLAHQALGDQGEDVAWFFKVATEIDPKYLDAYNNMCRAYYELQKYDLALDACQTALKIDPEFGPAQLMLGWVYLLGKSNPAEALRYFEAVQKKVNTPLVYYGMGLAYSMQDDNARVLEMVTTLRSMGAIDFASRLEQGIRRNESVSLPEPAKESLPPVKQSGTLIQAGTTTPAAAAPEESSPVSGNMRIRLKGRLQNTLPSAPPVHPGSIDTN